MGRHELVADGSRPNVFAAARFSGRHPTWGSYSMSMPWAPMRNEPLCRFDTRRNPDDCEPTGQNEHLLAYTSATTKVVDTDSRWERALFDDLMLEDRAAIHPSRTLGTHLQPDATVANCPRLARRKFHIDPGILKTTGNLPSVIGTYLIGQTFKLSTLGV